MGFFTSNTGMAEEFANPKVTQPTQMGGAGQSPLSSTQSVAMDPLSQLAESLSGGGNGGSDNLFADMQSLLNRQAGTVDLGSGFGGSPAFGTPSFDMSPAVQPRTYPEPDWTGFVDSNDGLSGFGQQGDSYQSLQDYLNASKLEKGVLSGVMGAIGIPSKVLELGHGINPLGSLFGEGTQTLPWYQGETTYTGSPISAAQASLSGGMFSGAGSQYEQDIIDMFGEGSPEHFEAIGETFGETPAAPPVNQEYVVPKNQGTVVPISEEGTNMDNTAGGYTWDSDYGSISDMQEETGLGTQEWDSNAEGFSWDDSSSDSGGGDSGGGGGSYIATAATQALGEEGLTIFEEWRDYMFTKLPTFTTSYGRYRVTAPKIVAEIDKREDSKQLYSWIWDMHLKPIFNLIKEDKDSEKALRDYKTMVKELQIRFLKEKV